MPISDGQIEETASRLLAALDGAQSVGPVSDGLADFGLDAAYKVAARIAERRAARGERQAGWKIGFTNSNIWDEYGVDGPIWGPVYDSTVIAMADGAADCPLAGLAEPRIEPEIVLRIAQVPSADMDDAAILACVDGVAHGFEIVQSVFPDWRFRPADTVAGFALHGRLYHGSIVETGGDPDWMAPLTSFDIALLRGGAEIDRGHASNVLGGPVQALGHLVRGLESDPSGRGLRPGDLITTGTVTRAFPVKSGERWTTRVHGLPVGGLALDCV